MDQDIELRHLRYFVTVAEELHFGRAAQRLHLSQPPLSQAIMKLEELLRYALFTRTSRTVSLTSAGQAFLLRARRTLQNVQRDIDETRRIGRGEVGSLNVGFIGSGMMAMLPGIFRSYREAYPNVHLQLHESFTSRVVEGLENGTLDAGILRDSDPAEGLHVTTIFTEPFVAVLPRTHRCAGQKSISPGVLKDEPFVFYPRMAGKLAYEKPLGIFEEYGFQPRVVQEGTHWMTILRLVGAGFGVSVAPACVQRNASSEVVCVPLRGVRVTSQIELAYVVGETRPIVEGFVRIAGGR